MFVALVKLSYSRVGPNHRRTARHFLKTLAGTHLSPRQAPLQGDTRALFTLATLSHSNDHHRNLRLQPKLVAFPSHIFPHLPTSSHIFPRFGGKFLGSHSCHLGFCDPKCKLPALAGNRRLPALAGSAALDPLDPLDPRSGREGTGKLPVVLR